MDEADWADIDQGRRVDAEIQTQRNLAKKVDAVIQGDGYCLECGKSVEPVNAKLKINGEWVLKEVYPRWCCDICTKIWDRDN